MNIYVPHVINSGSIYREVMPIFYIYDRVKVGTTFAQHTPCCKSYLRGHAANSIEVACKESSTTSRPLTLWLCCGLCWLCLFLLIILNESEEGKMVWADHLWIGVAMHRMQPEMSHRQIRAAFCHPRYPNNTRVSYTTQCVEDWGQANFERYMSFGRMVVTGRAVSRLALSHP